MSLKTTWRTGKNIVWLKKIQDNLYFLKKLLRLQHIGPESTKVNLPNPWFGS